MTGSEALHALGWDDRLATQLAAEAPGLVPGRILAEERGQYLVVSAAGEGPASPSGRLRHDGDTIGWSRCYLASFDHAAGCNAGSFAGRDSGCACCRAPSCCARRSGASGPTPVRS